MDEVYFGNKLFEGVSRDTLAALELDPESRSLDPGEVIFDEQDPGDEMYLVAKGSVRISKAGRGGEQETLVTISEGDYFGEMALLDGRPRSARASAVAHAEVGHIDGVGFRELLTGAPDVAVNFSRLTVERLRNANQHFIEQLLEGERMSLLGRMVGSIVHDFKNPMSTILLGTNILKEKKDDSVAQDLGGAIERAVDRMVLMTQELLDFSRGVSKVTPERMTVAELLQPVEEESQALLAKGDIEVTKNIAYDGDIVVDKHRIVRLLMNIIKNAVEAMSGKGTLTLAINRENNEITYAVSDTGCGMPPEVAQSVFEPFVSHGKKNGTGLGMAIAKSAVEAHGGRIWVDSVVGEGTTVSIAIPADPK